MMRAAMRVRITVRKPIIVLVLLLLLFLVLIAAEQIRGDSSANCSKSAMPARFVTEQSSAYTTKHSLSEPALALGNGLPVLIVHRRGLASRRGARGAVRRRSAVLALLLRVG